MSRGRSNAGRNREQYYALTTELKERGYVVLEEAPYEWRGAWGVDPGTSWDLVVRLDEALRHAEHLGIITFLLRKHLKGLARAPEGSRTRRVAIVGRRGEVLREVELPEE